MAAPLRPSFNPNTPIPNQPFTSPETFFAKGPWFNIEFGAGIDLTVQGIPTLTNNPTQVLAAGAGITLTTVSGITTITATGGGGGSGTVTSITAGTGLTGGTITTSGTIALANTAVTAGAYTAANITVDAQGRITAAANGSGGGGVTSVTGTTPISVTAGTTPVVSIAAASTAVSGAVQLATSVQTQTGTDTTLAVTPAGAAATYVACSTYAAKGTILGATGAGTPSALAVGSDGQVLLACSTATDGICWATLSAAAATPTVIGSVFGCTKGAGTLAVALGYQALNSNPTGDWNVAVGPSAGRLLSTGFWNTFIGACAGCASTTAIGSVFIGINAGTNSNGGQSVYIGNTAGQRAGDENVAIGLTALGSTTVGSSCTVAIGSCAAASVPQCQSVVVGAYASRYTSGNFNTAIGFGVLQGTSASCPAAPCNSSLGYKSLNAATTACLNVTLGYATGCAVTTGSQNVLIGPNVGSTCITESCTLAIGFSGTDNWLTGDSTKAIKPGAGIIDCASSTGTAGQVLMSNGSNAICWGTSASVPAATPTVAGIVKGCIDATNTALGCNALVANTTGLSNTVIGTSAGAALDDACFNTLIGKSAGCALDFGTGHTVIGEGAGTAITSSFYNVFVGAGAGCSSTQSRNVFIGACAGCAQTSGSSNVAIGDGINVPITTSGCQLAIGYGAGFVCWLTGNNTGAIKPGAGIIDCANSCGTVGQYLWTTGTNKIVWSASSPSDTRDKEVLGPVPTALPVVQQIEPITYRWKERESNVAQEEVIYGFSAQQLQEVDSILVDNSDPDHLRIHDRKIVPLLVKAIQELSAKVEVLEAKLEAKG